MKEQLLHSVNELLRYKQDETLKHLLQKQDIFDIVDLINGLHRGKRKTFSLLPVEIQAEVALHLSKSTGSSILARISAKEISRFLHFCDEDDATDILQKLGKKKQKLVLSYLKLKKRKKIEKLLHYGAETAGGLMDLNFLLVHSSDSLMQVQEKIHQHVQKEKQVPLIVVAKHNGTILGYIPHKALFLSSPKTDIKQLIKPMSFIHSHIDQEEVLHKIQKLRTTMIGVVDDKGSLIGIVHFRDLLKVAQSEATEDVFKFAGVDSEEHITDPVKTKVKRRSKWLIVNLFTAFLAASVVSLFQDTIAQLAILAVFMPIVAGEGGNAATQTLAVVVRGLSTREIDWKQARSVIYREAVAGALNGVIVGIIAGGVAWAIGSNPMLGLVLGIAMTLNLFVAGLFGALVPFTLKAFKIDPAVASSVFVTTATDIFGFFVFLGLGSLLLL